MMAERLRPPRILSAGLRLLLPPRRKTASTAATRAEEDSPVVVTSEEEGSSHWVIYNHIEKLIVLIWTVAFQLCLTCKSLIASTSLALTMFLLPARSSSEEEGSKEEEEEEENQGIVAPTEGLSLDKLHSRGRQ